MACFVKGCQGQDKYTITYNNKKTKVCKTHQQLDGGKSSSVMNLDRK